VVGTGGKHGAVVGGARNSLRPLAWSGDNALKEELGGRVAPGTGSSVWKPFLGEARVVASSETHSEGVRHSSPPPAQSYQPPWPCRCSSGAAHLGADAVRPAAPADGRACSCLGLGGVGAARVA
jgi:hypothetical protein